jgi:four helix bundle protein
MAYKFEQLEVWQRALDYADRIHDLAERLPKHERYNLADQMTRATNGLPTGVG